MENLSIPQTKVLNNDTILHLEDVSFSYHSFLGETDVLKNLSFSVKEGEFIAIVGPSGCGKSTLLNIICGLLKIKKLPKLITKNKWQMLLDYRQILLEELLMANNIAVNLLHIA